MLMFLLIGIFLALFSSYELFVYLETNQFVSKFPGDWDKPLGIAVGIFLIFRSRKFVNESKELFIKISKNKLAFRTVQSDAIRKIALSEINKIEEKKKTIILVTKDLTEFIIIDFNKVRLRDNEMKSIKKSLIELTQN